MRGVLLIVIVVLFQACTQQTCRDSIDFDPIELQVVRLEKELFGSGSATEVETFLARNTDFSNYILQAKEYPHDSILAKRIFGLISNASIDTLFDEAVTNYKAATDFVPTLQAGFGRLKAIYPETREPVIETVVTGLAEGGDLFISNDRIIIGLDFFVGEDATYKPLGIPDYILKRYTMEHLPSIILQFVSSQYVKPGKEDSMLSDMIDFGKNYYLLSQLLPCTPERILIGYSEEQWQDVFENDDIIWANFIQNKWLYETNHTIKQKFLSERPVVYEIGDKCPGRIGAWLGWQIVNAYMEKSEITLQQLMAETDHNKIFLQSGYKPGT